MTNRAPVNGELSYEIEVVGAGPPDWRDIYHALLNMPWWTALLAIVSTVLLLNLLFAFAYADVGGVSGARPGSVTDAFFFSVQTMGTIGYGSMYPVGRAANVLVVLESIVGLLVTALATGLVFVRFSLTRGRMVFARKATISPMDGIPTVSVRFGNGRSNAIQDATIRLMLMRTETTAEGVSFYRTHDLDLVRNFAHALTRSWSVLHRIDQKSPLFGQTPESLAESEAELVVTVSGVDSTSLQFAHGQHTYESFDIAWGARAADILSETADGNLRVDLSHFDEVVPTEPTPGFPYPRPRSAKTPDAG